MASTLMLIKSYSERLDQVTCQLNVALSLLDNTPIEDTPRNTTLESDLERLCNDQCYWRNEISKLRDEMAQHTVGSTTHIKEHRTSVGTWGSA
jgi:hypothetical protein